jgi:high-affinity Fe2+/Pb2+ permease
MKKFLILFTVMILAAFLFVAPVMAQTPLPAAPVAGLAAFPTVLLSIVIAIVLFWVVGFVVFNATEILKLLSRWVATVPALGWIGIQGYGSYVTALILAAIAVFYPGTGLATPLGNLFSALGFPVDANLVAILTTFLVSLIASAQQNSGKMPSPLASTAKAK